MNESQVADFFKTYAPVDVQNAVAWLIANGYQLASRQGEGAFGALFVYTGESEVRITVDRSQWCLDVAARPGRMPWQYDLLLAAHQNIEYGTVFRQVGARTMGAPLADQLPEGVSWRETLPDILEWIIGDNVSDDVGRALRQRSALMWPSRKARRTS